MGRSGRSSSPAPSRRSAPAPARQAPPPARQASSLAAPAAAPQQSMLGSLGSTMISGLAWGTGTSIARHGVDAMLGSGSSAPAQQVSQAPAPAQAYQSYGSCDLDQTAFSECIKSNPGSAGNCQLYFEALQQCQLNSK